MLAGGGVSVRQGRGGQGTVPLRGHGFGSGPRQQMCPLSRYLCSADPTLTFAQVSPLAPPTDQLHLFCRSGEPALPPQALSSAFFATAPAARCVAHPLDSTSAVTQLRSAAGRGPAPAAGPSAQALQPSLDVAGLGLGATCSRRRFCTSTWSGLPQGVPSTVSQ